ncbi:hypothetical protein BGZ49_004886, partial [Haplosporangium sp. Z 27]
MQGMKRVRLDHNPPEYHKEDRRDPQDSHPNNGDPITSDSENQDNTQDDPNISSQSSPRLGSWSSSQSNPQSQESDPISPESQPSNNSDTVLSQSTHCIDRTSSQEYPNGDVAYHYEPEDSERALDSRTTGWALAVYSHRTTKGGKVYHKSCLGVYVCPVDGCPYLERPRVPSTKHKHVLPRKPKTVCITHNCQLEHISCEATLKVTHDKTGVSFKHSGFHDHPKPHSIRPDAISRKKLKTFVEENPETKPKAALV